MGVTTFARSYLAEKMRIIDRRGLSLEVDRGKVETFHRVFLREGQAVSYPRPLPA